LVHQVARTPDGTHAAAPMLGFQDEALFEEQGLAT
jgi:hypothetical protein